MPSEAQLADLQQQLAIFRDARDWRQFHSLKNLAIAIGVEAGELLEHYIWSDSDEISEGVRHELADVLIQCLNFANAAGIDAAAAIEEKITLNAARYPVDKSYGTARKYTDLDDS